MRSTIRIVNWWSSLTFSNPGAVWISPVEQSGIHSCITVGLITMRGLSFGKFGPRKTFSENWRPSDTNPTEYSSLAFTSVTLQCKHCDLDVFCHFIISFLVESLRRVTQYWFYSFILRLTYRWKFSMCRFVFVSNPIGCCSRALSADEINSIPSRILIQCSDER